MAEKIVEQEKCKARTNEREIESDYSFLDEYPWGVKIRWIEEISGNEIEYGKVILIDESFYPWNGTMADND